MRKYNKTYECSMSATLDKYYIILLCRFLLCIVPKTCPICKKLTRNLKSVHKRLVSVIIQKHGLGEPLDYLGL